jgi:hypothetical protein
MYAIDSIPLVPVLEYHTNWYGTNGTYTCPVPVWYTCVFEIMLYLYVHVYHGTIWYSVRTTMVECYVTAFWLEHEGWKRAHMCTENHVCVLGGYTNAPTLSLPPSHHCLNGEQEGIATTMSASMQAWIQTKAGITPLSATSWGDGREVPLGPGVGGGAGPLGPPWGLSRKRWPAC